MKKLIICLIPILLLLIPASCTSTPPFPSGKLGAAFVSWAFHFRNLPDLCAYSDVIAIGTVDRVVEVVHEKRMLYFTKWAFRVEKVLKGEKVKELIIGQSGSPDQPSTDDREDPLFLPGEQYLLFLNGDSSGVYHNYGPQGRHLIWENKVYSMNYILLPEAHYKPPPELDFNGVELDALVDDINEIIDSVHLRFTKGKSGLQADILRYSAGTTLDIDAILLTGKNGPGYFTYKIDTEALPEGMEVSISPTEFTAYPQNEYKSTLLIMMTPELTPGSYQITVGYDFEGIGTGNRTITLNVNPYEVPQTGE